ncbi:MAG: carbohydrate ABC transporter permease, partial [Oscillospiraceae bacterium]
LEKVFGAVNYFLLSLVVLITLYPLVYVFSASISSSSAVISGEVILFPKEVTLDAYRSVLSEPNIWTAYANTIFYTVVGTAVSMLFTILGAYALSKKRLCGRTFFSFFIAFTMWFNAGIIPLYLTFRDYGLLNTRTGIILGFACNTFNVILLRTFFQSIPDALEEAANIDGANDWEILFKVYLPLSLPSLATVGLFYAVSRWNGYFWSMILLTDDMKIPLQVLLKKMIVEMSVSEQGAGDSFATFSKETFIYATIVVSVIPMLAVYPYIQKYFVKGMMVGSVKG